MVFYPSIASTLESKSWEDDDDKADDEVVDDDVEGVGLTLREGRIKL